MKRGMHDKPSAFSSRYLGRNRAANQAMKSLG